MIRNWLRCPIRQGGGCTVWQFDYQVNEATIFGTTPLLRHNIHDLLRAQYLGRWLSQTQHDFAGRVITYFGYMQGTKHDF